MTISSRCLPVARTHALIAALALTTMAGCFADHRDVRTDQELQQRAAAELKTSADDFRGATTRLLTRFDDEMKASGGAPPSHLDFLAISGGGDYGAFGAGFLVGWGQNADPAKRRPDFDVVTGVSTGALLAPFVYLNTDAGCDQVESFYRDPKPDWVQSRGLFFFLPTFPSFMKLPGLDRDVRAAIDGPFIEKMAEQSRTGKLLVVSATDLDLGRQKFWNVGLEAESAVKTGDYRRVQDILLASAAIPAAFPPIDIDGTLYADGGVTANVLMRLEPRNPDGVLALWRKAYPGKPYPKVRYWVIINNQLNQVPKTVQPTWPAIISPSLATAVRAATISEVRLIATQADFINAALKTDIEVRVVAIPDDWRAPVQGDFQKETMNSLADLGRKLGSDPKSWQLWASPTIPIEIAPPAVATPTK